MDEFEKAMRIKDIIGQVFDVNEQINLQRTKNIVDF